MAPARKPVIFLAFANDMDDRVGYLRNLPGEARQVRASLQQARQGGLCDVVEIANATAEDIFGVFQNPEYRDRIAVFHYGGHANGYELLLETPHQETEGASATRLADFLGQQKGLELVFLNGCSTQSHVRGLLQASVSSVIATARAIDDRIAMTFATNFYRGMATGAGIRRAFVEAESSTATSCGGETRGAYFGLARQSVEADRWPWELHFGEGAELAADWNLPDAAGDPLFGLPDIPRLDLPDRPFKHLHRFTEEDSSIFFGRGYQIRDLHDHIVEPDTAPVLLVYGQSGVGKSSVLSAGVIPRMRESHEVVYVRRSQRAGLKQTLRDALICGSETVAIDSVHFAEDWYEIEEQSGRPLVVIIDQVEECFTRPGDNGTNELDELLDEIELIFGDRNRRPHGKLLLCFRKEWLAEIETRLQEHRLPRAKVFLERLDRRGIIEAITGPSTSPRLSTQYKLRIEDNLAETIADELLTDCESAIAPTLQILLTTMWEHASRRQPSQPRFSLDLYRELKKNGFLLRDFLENQLASLASWKSDVTDSGLALDLLANHTTSMGTADSVEADDLPRSYHHRKDVIDELVQQCKDLYLLVDLGSDSLDGGGQGTRLSHDTLAPLVRSLFDDSDRPGQRARRVLANRISDWSAEQTGSPLDERDLQIVEQGLRGSRAPDTLEMKLIEFSRREVSRRKRLQNIFKVVAATAAVVIVTLGVLVVRGQWQLNSQKAEAFQQARSVVDEFYTGIANEELLDQPGMTPLRRQLLNQGKKFYEFFTARFGEHGDSGVAVANAHYNLGRIAIEQGLREEAISHLDQAIEAQRMLLEGSENDADLRSALSRSLMELGNAHFESGRLDEADTHFREARTIRHELTKDRGNSRQANWEHQLALADTYMNIGNLQMERANSIPQFKQAADSFAVAQTHRTVALGQVRQNSDDREIASTSEFKVQRAIALGEHSLKSAYENAAGFVLSTSENADEAEGLAATSAEHCNKAKFFLQQVLDKRPNDNLVRSRLADCWISLSYFEPASTTQHLTNAYHECRTLAFHFPGLPEYRRLLATCLIELQAAGIASAPDSAVLQSSQSTGEQAICILEDLLDEFPDDAEATSLLETARTVSN